MFDYFKFQSKIIMVALLVIFIIGCNREAEVLKTSNEPAPSEVVPKEAKDLSALAGQISALPNGTPVKLLFVVSVKRGMITKTGEGKRELTFRTSDVNSVMGFTDRPQRYAFSISVSALAAVWVAGKDSFAKDPPNAIVEDSRARVGVTEITGFTADGDAVKVSLDRMAYKSLDAKDSLDGEVQNLTLFIDSSLPTP